MSDLFAQINFDNSLFEYLIIVVGAALVVLLLVKLFGKKAYKDDYLKRAKLVVAISKQESIVQKLTSEILFKREFLENYRATQNKQKESLVKTDYLNMWPDKMLAKAKPGEIQSLKKVLKVNTSDPKELDKKLRSAGSHLLGKCWRAFREKKDLNVSYKEVVHDVAKKMKADFASAKTFYAKEMAIVEAITAEMLGKMDRSERAKFIQALEAEAEKHGKSISGLVVGGGAIALANASGFGVYLAASTAVGALTSAMGITLPFAFYTSMSSTIAVITGPVGIALLGGLGVLTLGSPNMEKTIPAVAIIASIRARLEFERLEAIEAIENSLAEREESLRQIEARGKKEEAVLAKLKSRWPKGGFNLHARQAA